MSGDASAVRQRRENRYQTSLILNTETQRLWSQTRRKRPCAVSVRRVCVANDSSTNRLPLVEWCDYLQQVIEVGFSHTKILPITTGIFYSLGLIRFAYKPRHSRLHIQSRSQTLLAAAATRRRRLTVSKMLFLKMIFVLCNSWSFILS